MFFIGRILIRSLMYSQSYLAGPTDRECILDDVPDTREVP